MTEAAKLFPPESLICRVNAEALVLLGGGRSILLQLAHPLVAAGVADYSNFQSDPLARLFRTLLFMHTIVFDDRRREQALVRFNTIHDHIQGRLQQDAGPFPEGTPYSGHDPELKLWVHATFVDTSRRLYEQFVQPLTPDERRSYYADTLVLAELMDIPKGILPQTANEFQSYMQSMIESDTLSVTDRSRQLAMDVLYPDVGLIPSASASLLRLVTAGLLPERLRTAYGLMWGWRQHLFLNGLSALTRSVRPFVPPWVWQNPLLGGGLSRYLLWETTGSPSESTGYLYRES